MALSAGKQPEFLPHVHSCHFWGILGDKMCEHHHFSKELVGKEKIPYSNKLMQVQNKLFKIGAIIWHMEERKF